MKLYNRYSSIYYDFLYNFFFFFLVILLQYLYVSRASGDVHIASNAQIIKRG